MQIVIKGKENDIKKLLSVNKLFMKRNGLSIVPESVDESEPITEVVEDTPPESVDESESESNQGKNKYNFRKRR